MLFSQMMVNPVIVKVQAWGGVVPMVNPACVVTIAVSKTENALGGAFRSSPGVLLLPATDGSNCAETHISWVFSALIIYAVCCTLLSKVPCSTVSECIHFRYEWSKGNHVNSS